MKKNVMISIKSIFAVLLIVAGTGAFAATTVTEQELDERDFQSTISLAGHVLGMEAEKENENPIDAYKTPKGFYSIQTILNTYDGKTLLRVFDLKHDSTPLTDVVLNHWGMKPVYFDREERLVVVNPGGGDTEPCTMVVFFDQTKEKTIAIPKDSRGCYTYPNIKWSKDTNFWSGKNTCFLVLAKTERQYSVNGKTNVYYKVVGKNGKFEWVFGEDVILNKDIFNSLPEEKF